MNRYVHRHAIFSPTNRWTKCFLMADLEIVTKADTVCTLSYIHTLYVFGYTFQGLTFQSVQSVM